MKPFLMASLALLAACETTWQSPSQPSPLTYVASQDLPERSVGRLRKLLLLPPVVELSGCGGAAEHRARIADRVQAMAAATLQDEKGYEVLVHGEVTPTLGSSPLPADFVAALVSVQENDPGHPVPQMTREQVQRIARAWKVDGVVVIHFGPHCSHPVTALFDMFVIFRNNSSVGVFGGSDGSLAWSHQEAVFTTETLGGWNAMPGANVRRLFWDLERAMPSAVLR